MTYPLGQKVYQWAKSQQYQTQILGIGVQYLMDPQYYQVVKHWSRKVTEHRDRKQTGKAWYFASVHDF